jgi:hypothetical protein
MERTATMVFGYGKTIWKSVTGNIQEESFDSITFPHNIPVFPSIDKIEHFEYEEDFSQTLVMNNNLRTVSQMILTITEARKRLKNFTQEAKKREEEFDMKELDDLNEFLRNNSTDGHDL